MSAAAADPAAACREDLAGHLAGPEGRGSCSRDPARWVGTAQVGTIPGVGIPCQIHQAQEDQDQVGPNLVEEGKEGTCWGFGTQVRQVDREDRWGQELGWRQEPVLDEREPSN